MNGTKRLGFFTRLLDETGPAERYRLAVEQIRHAEALGFSTAWVAQHHFDGHEGGLPSPFVLLADAAAKTSTIRLGTGIVTLSLDDPLRVAEDAAVLDLMSGGRLEIGLGTGGSPSAFTAFGIDNEERGAVFGKKIGLFLQAIRGEALPGGLQLYPPATGLIDRLWQATFSVAGGARAGEAGDGLMLSRTQPRAPDAPRATLAEIQQPIVDAYLERLPAGAEPRIMASRSIYVADSRREALRFAEIGLSRYATRLAAMGRPVPTGTLSDVIAAADLHIGTPDEVIASLAADATLERATEIAAQVHSVDPPPEFTLRSMELFATVVAPALGWVGRTPAYQAARESVAA